MKQSKILNAILFVSGLVGIVVGGGMLFSPVEFHATSGVLLDGSTNLNNEMRAAGGPILVGGIIIVAAAFFERLRFAATLMSGAFYLSYGSARIVSIMIDGMPSTALIQITGLEISMGIVLLTALYFLSTREPTHAGRNASR